MPDQIIAEMIESATEKNAVLFKNLLENSMNERLATELRDMKMELASRMFGEDNSPEDVEEGIKQFAQNVGRVVASPVSTAMDSWKMDKMHDRVKAGLKKQQPKSRMPKKENYELDEDEVEEGIVRNVGRGVKAAAKGVFTPIGAYANSRKSDAIQRDVDKLKATKASKELGRARSLTRQTEV